jgi:hypothetical protein
MGMLLGTQQTAVQYRQPPAQQQPSNIQQQMALAAAMGLQQQQVAFTAQRMSRPPAPQPPQAVGGLPQFTPTQLQQLAQLLGSSQSHFAC